MARQEFFSSTFHYTFGPHAPTVRVHSEDALTVLCPDSDNLLADGSLLPSERRQRTAGTTLKEANPLAGPIYVESAVIGDSIVVTIDAVHLDSALGRTGLAPDHGLLAANLLLGSSADGHVHVPRHMYRWRIDPPSGTATMENALGAEPVSVPLRPFIGCVGVCPPLGKHIASLFSGVFGGNMDLPLVRPGASVWLPVFHDGALLALGDIHAAQGHGEIIGGAIETTGRIDCTIRLRKARAIEAPRIVDAERAAAVGVDRELRRSVERAYAHLVEWLAEAGLNRFDAYNLVSQTGSIEIGNLLAPPYPVAAHVPLSVLPDRCRRSIQEGIK